MAPCDPEQSNLSEDERDEIHNRWESQTHDTGHNYDWRFILDPIKDAEVKKKYIELLEYIRDHGDEDIENEL